VNRYRAAIWAFVLLSACSRPSSVDPAPAPSTDETAKQQRERDAVTKLLGTTPPEWKAERWLNSAPRTLASLRGHVVLVRWWTAGCPYCSTSAPALRAFHQTYGARGLQVIGLYHHKEDTPVEPSVYEDTARKYGFTFPVAFDPDWQTLESWMHDAAGNPVSTGWTSVTFVLDRQGVVRHVHPGGDYVDGDAEHAALEQAIVRLLDAKS
jgi:peroxiredoxin